MLSLHYARNDRIDHALPIPLCDSGINLNERKPCFDCPQTPFLKMRAGFLCFMGLDEVGAKLQFEDLILTGFDKKV